MSTNDAPPGSLASKLAAVLPKDKTFHIYHVSTPPLKTDALCSAPPNERPDRTFCEKHFLAISIDVPASGGGPDVAADASQQRQVMVLGLEIYIFTTAHLTILFVSKADSTGYLSLLNLPKGTSSPIREISGAFISFLVENRTRPNIQFTVSLFARAQSQYLFPGSVDNKTKHVLDDRGLIKWWCRVLNPLVESPPAIASKSGKAHGYLVVPGLDAYETKAFIPRSSLSVWSSTHPLEKISHYTREFDWVPPRCLIPRYPDDPKSRFRDELDEEAHKSGAMRTTGSWQSVKSLDMFWEMMAFRQECSSGRMTGFAWVVFNDRPAETDHIAAPETPKKQTATINITTPGTTPRKLFTSTGKAIEQTKSKPEPKRKGRKSKEKKKIKLKGLIKTRPPRSKVELRNYLLDKPQSTAYYYWPEAGRGEKIVSEDGYKRSLDLMLHLDFATLDKGCGSTKRWISEVGLRNPWGCSVIGTVETPTFAASVGDDGASTVNNLSGLIKRKRADTASTPAEPMTLNVGLIRKKPKA